MTRGRRAKTQFEDLDSDFKTLIEDGTEEEIRAKISLVALNEAENQENKSKDMDLKEKGENYKQAGAQYKDAAKMNKLRIGYARSVLGARGKL